MLVFFITHIKKKFVCITIIAGECSNGNLLFVDFDFDFQLL